LIGYLYDEPNPEPQHAVKELGLSPDEHGEVDQNLLNKQGQGSLRLYRRHNVRYTHTEGKQEGAAGQHKNRQLYNRQGWIPTYLILFENLTTRVVC